MLQVREEGCYSLVLFLFSFLFSFSQIFYFSSLPSFSQDAALEIFLDNQRNHFFYFFDPKVRNQAIKSITRLHPPKLVLRFVGEGTRGEGGGNDDNHKN